MNFEGVFHPLIYFALNPLMAPPKLSTLTPSRVIPDLRIHYRLFPLPHPYCASYPHHLQLKMEDSRLLRLPSVLCPFPCAPQDVRRLCIALKRGKRTNIILQSGCSLCNRLF